MKTNKKHSDDIASKQTVQEEQVSKTDTKEKKKKFRFGKKFWAITCSVVVVLAVGLTLGLVFGLGGNKFDLDGVYIANFEEYTAIGSGTQAKTKAQVASTGAFSTASTNGGVMRLVGLKDDGTVEEIQIARSRNGKEKKLKWNISSIRSFKNFTLVEFTKDNVYFCDTYSFTMSATSGDWLVLIDNRTGKFYSLESLLQIPDNYFDIYFSPLNAGSGKVNDASESEDSLFFYGEEEFIYEDNRDEMYFYKATVVGEELEVTRLFNLSDGSNFVSHSDTCVDKYGNVFLLSSGSSALNISGVLNASYIFTTERKVISLNETIYRSINGIVYTNDGNFKFDEKGNKVENTFTKFRYFAARDSLIKKDGNVEYYLKTQSNSSRPLENIEKVTWLNEEEFSVETIKPESISNEYVVTQDKIFFREDEYIYSIDMDTGAREDIISDYFFTSINTDYLGNVVFIGFDEDLRTVNGVIKNDGTIELGVKPKDFNIYYIKPLN